MMAWRARKKEGAGASTSRKRKRNKTAAFGLRAPAREKAATPRTACRISIHVSVQHFIIARSFTVRHIAVPSSVWICECHLVIR